MNKVGMKSKAWDRLTPNTMVRSAELRFRRLFSYEAQNDVFLESVWRQCGCS